MSYMKQSLFLACLCLLALPSAAAFAEDKKAGADMVDISAEESLEWHQKQQLYIARKKAKVIKGNMTIEADLLTAHQRSQKEGDSAQQKQGANDLDLLTAEGNVYIHDPDQKVYGESAKYDIDKGVIKITGNNLKYITKSDIVTARDSLEYYEKKKIAIARGKAIAEHDGTRIKGDVMVAYFTQGKTGGLELKELHAKDNVTIVTKGGEVSRGQRAVYKANKDIAILQGKVRITRGKTQLSGDKAAVNFKTGQSRLLNKGSGRVRVLLPASGQGK